MTIRPRFMASQSLVVLGALAFTQNCVGRSGDTSQAVEPLSVQVNAKPPQSLRRGDPHAHGINDAELEALRAILRKAVENKTVPGVSLLLSHQGEIIFKESFGNLAVDQKVLDGLKLKAGQQRRC